MSTLSDTTTTTTIETTETCNDTSTPTTEEVQTSIQSTTDQETNLVAGASVMSMGPTVVGPYSTDVVRVGNLVDTQDKWTPTFAIGVLHQTLEEYDQKLWDQFYMLITKMYESEKLLRKAIDSRKLTMALLDHWGSRYDGDAMKNISCFTDLIKTHFPNTRVTPAIHRDLAMINTALEEYKLSDPISSNVIYEDAILWINVEKLRIARRRLVRIIDTLLPNRTNDLPPYLTS